MGERWVYKRLTITHSFFPLRGMQKDASIGGREDSCIAEVSGILKISPSLIIHVSVGRKKKCRASTRSLRKPSPCIESEGLPL